LFRRRETRAAPAQAVPAQAAPAQAAPAQAAPAQEAPAQAAPAQTAAAQTAAPQTVPSKCSFWGLMAGPVFNDYSFHNDEESYGSYGSAAFNGGLLFGYDFGLLAGQAELIFTGDKGSFSEKSIGSSSDSSISNKSFSATTLQIPLLLKLDFHGSRIMLQPQAGIYFNVALGELDYKYNDQWGSDIKASKYHNVPFMGTVAGWALGFRIGRGYLFNDTRFTRNLDYTEPNGTSVYWRRSAIVVSFGYQYYFRGKQ
jgi:hypothetical protein